MKAVIVLSIILSFPLMCQAQVSQASSQYYNNLHRVNPAFIGFNNFTEFRAGFRQPWNEISSLNTTNYANFTTTLSKKSPFDFRSQPLRISDPNAINNMDTKEFSRKHGIGVYLSQSDNGAFGESAISGVYAYHIPLTKKSFLSFGTSLTWLQQEIDFSRLTVRDNDAFFNDLVTNGDRVSYFKLDAGVLFYTQRFHVGFALNSAVDEVIAGNDLFTTSSVGDAFTAIIGNSMQLSNQVWINPTFRFIRIGPSVERLSLDTKLTFNDRLMVGLMYQNNGLYSALLELRFLEAFSLGYSYDYSSDPLGDLANGIHEISLGILLSKLNDRSSLIWKY